MLAIDQVVAIARRAPAYIDGEIVELAAMLTVTQLRRVLARYPFPTMPDDDTAEPDPLDDTSPTDGDRWWCGSTDDGRWRLHAATTMTQGRRARATRRPS